MKTTIFKPILSDRDFYHGLIVAITEKLQVMNVQIPTDYTEKQYIEIVIPEVVWAFFYRYKPNTKIQGIAVAWALEYGDLLLHEKENIDLLAIQEKFLITKGYEKHMRREIKFN